MGGGWETRQGKVFEATGVVVAGSPQLGEGGQWLSGGRSKGEFRVGGEESSFHCGGVHCW